MLPDLFNLRVTRLRGTTDPDDTHGNPVVDWSSPVRLTMDGCWIGRPSGVEISEGRQTVITETWWWGPEDADVLETDRIQDDRGVVWEVNGPVLYERDPNGLLEHKTCRLREVTG